MEFDDLPDDLLNTIFLFMGGSGAARISSVCKRFNELISCDEIWEQFCNQDKGIVNLGIGFDKWRAQYIADCNWDFLCGTWGESWSDVLNKKSITIDRGPAGFRVQKKGFTMDGTPGFTTIKGQRFLTYEATGGWNGLHWKYFIEPIRENRLTNTTHPLAQKCLNRTACAFYVFRNATLDAEHERRTKVFAGILFRTTPGDGYSDTRFDRFTNPIVFFDLAPELCAMCGREIPDESSRK